MGNWEPGLNLVEYALVESLIKVEYSMRMLSAPGNMQKTVYPTWWWGI